MRWTRTRLRGRGFAAALGGIALLAFGVRLGYAESVYNARGLGDDWWYHWMADAIAAGRGFNNPLETLVNGHAVRGFAGAPIPTAYHPPLFPVVTEAPPVKVAFGGSQGARVGIRKKPATAYINNWVKAVTRYSGDLKVREVVQKLADHEARDGHRFDGMDIIPGE